MRRDLFRISFRTRIYFLILGILFVATFYGGTQTYARMAFGAYRPVPATVLSSEVVRSSHIRRRRSRHYYDVRIMFEYSGPAGKGTSSRFSVADDEYRVPEVLDEKGHAERFQAKWPVGREFTAYQRIGNPTVVVAENPSQGAGIYGVMAGFGLAAMLGVILHGLLNRKNVDPAYEDYEETVWD